MRPIPDQDEIVAALTSAYKLPVVQANQWARFLAGLPWRYIHPIVRIAINAHHQHPAIVLGAAIATSEDAEFVATGRVHLEAAEPTVLVHLGWSPPTEPVHNPTRNPMRA